MGFYEVPKAKIFPQNKATHISDLENLYFQERLRMRDKMQKPESKDVYRLRKCTVEPVIGNIKQNLGFREFLLKGLDNAKIEINLVSIAHYLGKIWRMKRAVGC